eukprot:742867-Amphidinium_carterae.1
MDSLYIRRKYRCVFQASKFQQSLTKVAATCARATSSVFGNVTIAFLAGTLLNQSLQDHLVRDLDAVFDVIVPHLPAR